MAMENSHRRIVAELRDDHEQQIQQMKHEKEEALAEETQATLAGKIPGLNLIDCIYDTTLCFSA